MILRRTVLGTPGIIIYYLVVLLYSVPSQPPQELKGLNTSSTSIKVTWTDVPESDRNGIITGYSIYYRLESSGGAWSTVNVNPDQYFVTLTSLQFWSVYDLKIAASTSKGIGIESAIIKTRTDEDGK